MTVQVKKMYSYPGLIVGTYMSGNPGLIGFFCFTFFLHLLILWHCIFWGKLNTILKEAWYERSECLDIVSSRPLDLSVFFKRKPSASKPVSNFCTRLLPAFHLFLWKSPFIFYANFYSSSLWTPENAQKYIWLSLSAQLSFHYCLVILVRVKYIKRRILFFPIAFINCLFLCR